MLGSLLEPEIKELIEAKNFAALREVFAEEWHPADIAEIISDFTAEEQVLVFRILKSGRTFSSISIMRLQKHGC